MTEKAHLVCEFRLWQHVEAGGEDHKLGGENAELPLFRLSGEARHAHDVSPFYIAVQRLKLLQAQLR